MATAAGISPSQFSRVLNGQKSLTLDQLDAICAALGIDVVNVLAEADARSRAERRHVRQDGLALAASDDDDWQAREEAEAEW